MNSVFANWPTAKIYCSTQIHIHGAFMVILDMCGDLPHTFCSEVKQGDPLPSYSGSFTVNEHLFLYLLSAMFFTFLCFFKGLMTPPRSLSPEVLSCVPKCKEIVMWLTEKMHVLDWLCADMSDSSVGCEFNVNELTYILSKMSLITDTYETWIWDTY